MNCPFPEHHSSGGSGSWWPLAVAVIVAALFASVIGTIIHILATAMVFVGIAALAVGGGRLWWMLAHRPRRELPVQYRPQMTSRWGRPGLPQDQPDAIGQGGQHLHLHLGGLTPAERAEVMRQIRGQ
jgi:hypothetical protein